MARKKNKKSTKKSRSVSFYKVSGVVLTCISVLLFLFAFNSSPIQKHVQIVSKDRASSKLLSAITLAPSFTPIPTASPSPSLSPTPTIPKGFCLYVPVLMYHHIQPQVRAVEKRQTALSVDNGVFDNHLAYLVSRGYTAISAEQLVNALISRSQLSGKNVVITIDDGYRDGFEYAYPILQKYHMVGNFMIATGLLGGEDYMTWDHLSQMKNSGLAYFTNHTWSHYALGRGNATKIKYEIDTGRQQLEANLGIPITILTYPYGSFSDLAISVTAQSGAKAAFTTLPGSYQCDSSLMTLPRTRIGNGSLSAYGL